MAAWAVMCLSGLVEYTWGALSGSLQAAHHWGDAPTFWLFSFFVIFESFVQIGTGFLRNRASCGPLGDHGRRPDLRRPRLHDHRLRRRTSGRRTSATRSWAASAPAWSTRARSTSSPSGTRRRRAGGPASSTAAGPTARCRSSSPSAASPPRVASAPVSAGATQHFILIQGIIMTVGIGVFGWFLKDPPKNWWPAEVNPLDWAKNKRTARDLLSNPPALGHYSLKTMWATPQAKWLGIQYALYIGCSLFGVAFYFSFGTASTSACGRRSAARRASTSPTALPPRLRPDLRVHRAAAHHGLRLLAERRLPAGHARPRDLTTSRPRSPSSR